MDLYSPPKSDIQPCTDVLYCVFTIDKNCLVAVIAALLARIGTVHAIEVKSSMKMIRYLYLWYDSVRKDLMSVWTSSKPRLVHTLEGWKER